MKVRGCHAKGLIENINWPPHNKRGNFCSSVCSSQYTIEERGKCKMKICVSFLIVFCSVFVTVSPGCLIKAPEYGLRSPTWLNYYVFLRRGKKQISENVREEEDANKKDGSKLSWLNIS
jgi:hypothetical protein